VLATGYGEVTAEVKTGFVVVQVKGILQLLAPFKIKHEAAEGVRVPDIPGEILKVS
jgi:hypothetical protein